jgi:hypothetical protein
MLWRLPTWARAMLALAMTMLCLWPCMSFYWCLVQVIAPTPQAPDPTTISSPIPLISLATLSRLGVDDTAGIAQATVATLLAILFYTMITRWSGHTAPAESLCRRCRNVLRGIASPQCPICGEPL